ncbi:MAG: hypothetical protein V3U31_01995 [Dehalococcoidia bacterium]
MVEQTMKENPKPLRRIKVVYVLLMLGIGMEVAAFVTGLVLGAINADYFANTKAVRDAAQAGSPILTQLGQMKAVSAWLLPFQFLGIAILFTAIGLALSAIIKRIQLRGQVMAEGLGKLIGPE